MKLNLLLIIFLFLSCSYEQKETAEEFHHSSIVGKFVYVDSSMCLHTDRNCPFLMRQNVSVFIDTSNVYKQNYKYMCIHCVSDTSAEKILSITRDTARTHDRRDLSFLGIDKAQP